MPVNLRGPYPKITVNLGHLNAMLSVVQCDDAGPTCFFNRILDSRRVDISSGLDTEKPTICLSHKRRSLLHWIHCTFDGKIFRIYHFAGWNWRSLKSSSNPPRICSYESQPDPDLLIPNRGCHSSQIGMYFLLLFLGQPRHPRTEELRLFSRRVRKAGSNCVLFL